MRRATLGRMMGGFLFGVGFIGAFAFVFGLCPFLLKPIGQRLQRAGAWLQSPPPMEDRR